MKRPTRTIDRPNPRMSQKPPADQQSSSNQSNPGRTNEDKPNREPGPGQEQIRKADAGQEQPSDQRSQPHVVRMPPKTHPPKLLGRHETPKDPGRTTQQTNRTKAVTEASSNP